MAVRTDVTIDFTVSPRLITFTDLATPLTLQDLGDTLRRIEDDSSSMDNEHLLNAAGKDVLGGGVLVGITGTLNDAQIEPLPNVTPRGTGTATTGNAAGILLIDSVATFQSDGVSRGDVVINFTDRSMASVLSVDSENQLTTRVLTGGTDDDWDIGDGYGVYQVVQFDIEGGNLVAIDALGAELSPIFPSFSTQVIRAASSSATINENDAADLLLVKQMLAGRAVVSLDDLTVTVYAEDDVTVLATFAISVDGRERTRTS